MGANAEQTAAQATTLEWSAYDATAAANRARFYAYSLPLVAGKACSRANKYKKRPRVWDV